MLRLVRVFLNGQDANAFEKRVKADMKTLGDSKAAAEGACDKLLDGLASHARTLVDKVKGEMRKVELSRLSLQPVIKNLQAAVSEMEGSASK